MKVRLGLGLRSSLGWMRRVGQHIDKSEHFLVVSVLFSDECWTLYEQNMILERMIRSNAKTLEKCKQECIEHMSCVALNWLGIQDYVGEDGNSNSISVGNQCYFLTPPLGEFLYYRREHFVVDFYLLNRVCLG